MHISPLNLISTPLALLNSLGLDLRVGLSSEDPMVGRHPTEAYEAYLTTYSPEGLLMDRRHHQIERRGCAVGFIVFFIGFQF